MDNFFCLCFRFVVILHPLFFKVIEILGNNKRFYHYARKENCNKGCC